MREDTKKWLEYHGFLTKGTTLDMYDEAKHREDTLYKKEVVERFGIDVMIEDSLEIAKVMDVLVFLLDRPWNQGELSPHITRVKDWEEAENKVKTFTLR
jgi:2,3-bisphosphoglycerate-independent phosphoglycerate mutase